MFNTLQRVPAYRAPNSAKGNVLGWGVVLLILIAILFFSSLVAGIQSDTTAPPRGVRYKIESGSYMIEPNETILPGDQTPEPVAMSHIPQPTMVPNTFPDPFPSNVPPMDMGSFPGRTEFRADLYMPKA